MRSRVARLLLRGGAALALAGGLLAGGAGPAGAHATLVGTVPAADGELDAVPDAVELQFDEPVETVDDAVQVYGPDGDRVDLGTVESDDGGATLRAPIEADAQGTYTVAWRVTSEDSHTLSGSFVFHNGTRTGAVDVGGGTSTTTGVLGGVGRWLGFAGALTAVGAAALALLLPRPGSAGEQAAVGTRESDGPDGSEAPDPDVPTHGGAGGSGRSTLTAPAPAATATTPDEPDAMSPTTLRRTAADRLRLLTAGGAAAGAVGAALALLAIVAEGSGRSLYDALGIVADVAPDTRTGQLALLRVVLAAGAAVVASVPALWRRSPVPALVLAAGSLVVATVAGHAWTAPNRWVAVTSDVAHLGAVAVWIGGLVALLAVLPLLDRPGRVAAATRFSAVALGAVVVVAASGTVSGWQQVRTLDALTSTGYGRLLILKVVGFAVLVVLGFVNRAVLIPLVERTVAPLRRSMRIELAVAALVLAVTAALIHQPPARSDAAEPYDTTATVESGEVLSATVDPAEAGPNDLHLFFSAPDGTTPAAVDAVQVTAGTTGVPPRRLQVTPVSTNHVTVAGASLPSPGTWTVEVTAVQAGRPLVFTFEVPIT